MSGMSDMDDLERKQGDAAKLAMKMVDEKDPERLKEMAEQILEKTKELEKMARGMEAFYTPKGPSGEETYVVLTPEQRERIVETTGVGIEVVTLRDTPDVQWKKEMPKIEPRVIEKMAAKQAAESKLVSETRKAVEDVIQQLEKLNVPELQETIENLKRDPTLGRGKSKK
jgi:hypothetical protein